MISYLNVQDSSKKRKGDAKTGAKSGGNDVSLSLSLSVCVCVCVCVWMAW